MRPEIQLFSPIQASPRTLASLYYHIGVIGTGNTESGGGNYVASMASFSTRFLFALVYETFFAGQELLLENAGILRLQEWVVRILGPLRRAQVRHVYIVTKKDSKIVPA